MRGQALSCLSQSGLIDQNAVDLLDQEWDLLGVDRVCTFVTQFLVKQPDSALTEGSGPFAFLTGMVASMRTSQKDSVKELMETYANVAADLKLASQSITMFRSSMTEAEGVWKDQSSLCSGYLSRLESQLKNLKLQLDNPRLPQKETTPGTSGSAPKRNIDHSPYAYKKECGIYKTVIKGTPTAYQNQVIKQINVILEFVDDAEMLTLVHPEHIYKTLRQFHKVVKDPNQAMEETIAHIKSNLSRS